MLIKKIAAALMAAFVFTICGCTALESNSEKPVTETAFSERTAASSAETASAAETSAEAPEVTEASATTAASVYDEIQEELDADWALYLVNNENPLPDNFSVVTKPVQGERELDVRCADFAIAMIKAAADDGIKLKVSSAYRSVEKQRDNIKMYIEWYVSLGYSYEEATAKTYGQVAVPGCSEHNAGIAMDIESEDYFDTHAELETDFDTMPEFDWLIQNCYKYGFILSFPKDKEKITGFPYEPWHYRYVGIEHATAIHELGITLNEYIAGLE